MNNVCGKQPKGRESTEEEAIERMQEEVYGRREECKRLYKTLEEKELENKELKEMNRKLMLMAFPEATKHLMEMVSSISKTIKGSGLNE